MCVRACVYVCIYVCISSLLTYLHVDFATQVSSDHNPSPLDSAIETSVCVTTTTPTVTSAEQPNVKHAVKQYGGRSSEKSEFPFLSDVCKLP